MNPMSRDELRKKVEDVVTSYHDYQWKELATELLDLIERERAQARADVANECYLQCLAAECGEGECAEAIRTKFTDLITQYQDEEKE